MKCIEDELPFELPDGWEWCRLKSLTIKIGAGSTPTGGASVYSLSDGIKFIRSQNVYDDGLRTEDIAYISEEINNKKKGSIVKPKDILLNITGGSIGRCALISDDFDIGNVNQHVMIIRMVEEQIRCYVHKTILSPYIQNQIFGKQVGSGRGGLSAETLSSFLIPLPPLREQEKIISTLGDAISLITRITDDKESLVRIIELTKAKILEKAIRGELVPQLEDGDSAQDLLERISFDRNQRNRGKKNETVIFRGDDNSYYEQFADGSKKVIEENILFDLPDTWTWTRLGNISKLIQYGLSNSAESHGEYRLLRITDIQNGNVDWNSVPFTNADNPNDYLLQKDDIVFARTGATVGKSFLLGNIPYPSVFASYLIRIRLYDSLLPEYVYSFFNSPYYWSQITDKAVGVGQSNCNGTSLKELYIPIPPIEEQQRIVSQIRRLFLHLDEIQEALS